MLTLVKVIGIFIACMGVAIFLIPKAMLKMIAYWREGKRLYLGAMLRILFGVIFLLAASQARYPAVMLALGIFSFIAGAMIFILGLEKIKAFLNWWNNRPIYFLRLAAILVSLFGILIIYSA